MDDNTRPTTTELNLGIILDKLLEDIVDNNCDGYNYSLTISAERSIRELIAEAYKQGLIDGSIEVINNTCEICHAYPMTANCDNAGCDV